MLLSNPRSISDLSLSEKLKNFSFLLWKHLRRFFITYVLIFCLFSLFKENYRFAINETPSLPYSLLLIHFNEPPERDGLVAFAWHGGEPYPDGYTFVKRLRAIPGDRITKRGRDFIIGNDRIVGLEVGQFTKRALSPNQELKEGVNVVPDGKYFVTGDHESSLDSRYSLLGLVSEEDVIGSAYVIF